MLASKYSFPFACALLATACQSTSPTAAGDASGGVSDATSAATSGVPGQSGQGSTSGGDTAAASEGSSSAAGPNSSGPVPIGFDVGGIPDAGNLGCGGAGGGIGGGGDPEFSYVWIANSNEGTISKINTQTMVEEGRYIVRPDSAGSPSRTSVNLNGDVAVANRNGGVTMIAARPENCPNPANTSSGPGDVRPWPDGCVLWHTPFVYTSQRPVAWTQGEWNGGTCRYEDTKLWTSGANATIDVLLLDGETGMVEETIPVPGVAPSFFGIYGAAVDANGDFWGSQLGQGTLVNIALSDLQLRTWPMAASGYGMTVDHTGQVWTCSSTVARFSPLTETWMTASVGGNAGCMEDGQGTLWLANNPMVGIDINTMAVVDTIALPNYVHGVSVDFYGYVWGPAIYNDEAYRIDPVTHTIDTITGLNFPYTYSDMTGFALTNAGTPSG